MFVVLSLVGALIICFALFVRQKGIVASNWPSVSGEIMESKIVSDPHDDDSSVIIRYRYTVNQESFESTQVSFKVRPHSPMANQTLVERFPIGQFTPVFFNPKKPKEAVIDNSPNSSWLFIAAIGVLVIIVGVIEHHPSR